MIGNGLDRISRIPLYSDFNIPRYNKGHTYFPDNLPMKLDQFYTNHCVNRTDIYIGYNSYIVLIQAHNTVDWTKELHESFCKELGVILHQVCKTESWEFKNYMLELSYVYIPKYYKNKWNKDLSVDFDNLRL